MSSTGSGVLWLENRKDLEDLTEAPLHNVPAPEGSENPKAGVTLFYGFHAIIDGFQECYRIAQQTMCHIEPIELILDDGGHSAAGPVPDTILPELKILHLERCTRKLQDRVMNIWQEFLEAEGNPPNKSLTSRGVYVKNLLTERMDLVRVLWEHEDFNHLSAITLSPATTNYEGGGNRVPSNAFLQSDSDHSPALLSRQRLSSEFRDIPISVSSNGETVRLSLDQADVFLAGDSQNGIEGLTEQLEPKLISLLSKGEGVTLETAIPNLDPRYSARIALGHAAPAPYAERQAPAPSR